MKTVDSQRKQFKRYGIWGDWEEPHIDALAEHEYGRSWRFSGNVSERTHLSGEKKPVHWSPSSMTALALRRSWSNIPAGTCPQKYLPPVCRGRR